MDNRRHFSRILFDIKAELEVADHCFMVSIHDLSLNGALTTIPDKNHSIKGKEGQLNFLLSDGLSQVSMQVLVVHEHKHEIGLQCQSIDIDSITHLRRLVELNLGDESQLNRELSDLTRLHQE